VRNSVLSTDMVRTALRYASVKTEACVIQDLGLAVALQDGEGLFVMTLVLLEPMVQIVQAHACVRIRAIVIQ